MLRILVTGGAGFIGSHVVDRCIELGHDVAVVDNLVTGRSGFVNPAARLHCVDITDGAALEEVFRAELPEVICHQAAQMEVRKSIEDPVYDATVNILGTIRLLQLAVAHGTRRFVYACTGGALYGEPETLPIPEDHPIEPLSPYGISKHTVEHYLSLYRHLYGISYVSLRYANVYGPRQNPHGEAGVIAIFASRMLQGKLPLIHGDGEQTRDFVYVADVAEANARALESSETRFLSSGKKRGGEDCGCYNIGTGRQTSVNEIFRLLADRLAFDQPAEHGPPKPGDLLRNSLDPSRAREVLGWEPRIGLEEGMDRAVAYFREEFVRSAGILPA